MAACISTLPSVLVKSRDPFQDQRSPMLQCFFRVLIREAHAVGVLDGDIGIPGWKSNAAHWWLGAGLTSNFFFPRMLDRDAGSWVDALHAGDVSGSRPS